jgi:PAS domain-containing protein
MSLRTRLADALVRDREAFRASAAAVVSAFGLAQADRRLEATEAVSFDGPAGLPEFDTLSEHTKELVWRLWLFDTAPVGLTLAGPAYEDTPLMYVTATSQKLTGYPLSACRSENPRLLQGPGTDPAAVSTPLGGPKLGPRTVELRNYRADGTAFRNRVSLIPVPGDDGTVRTWVGIQAAVGADEPID